jgi:hypothetical protein
MVVPLIYGGGILLPIDLRLLRKSFARFSPAKDAHMSFTFRAAIDGFYLHAGCITRIEIDPAQACVDVEDECRGFVSNETFSHTNEHWNICPLLTSVSFSTFFNLFFSGEPGAII